MRRTVVPATLLVLTAAGTLCSPAQAQTPSVTVPTVTVTAQKEPADQQTLPLSLSTVATEWLRLARITNVADAVVFTPNLVVTEFTARKLSNPRARGVGASPLNPAVTTFLDGVPMLNANASNSEFTGIGQVEFVRGPQSALFGRNTLGGVINIVSERPSLGGWTGEAAAPFGNFGTREVRGGVSGRINARLAVGFSGGKARRDGFTVNTLTGNDVDGRDATFGKGQLLFAPSSRWETRVIVSGERAEDGDYALNDLGEVRRNPFRVARDFEGFTSRDLFNATVLNRYEGGRISLTATTGLVRWETDDQTDLDYTPLPIARRSNLEDATQFSQEIRVSSAAASPYSLSPALGFRWQAGVLVFTHEYQQEAVNTLAPFTVSPVIGFPVQQTSPRAALDDFGLGVYGQGTFTVREQIDLSIGARVDREARDAQLETFFTPQFAPGTRVDTEDTFSNVSPQAAVAWRVSPRRMVYASLTRGYKAGGFNPASPTGQQAFGEEHTWNIEGGVKSSFLADRVVANAAVFFTDWSDLQLNVPNPTIPAQFYVANVGGAASRGVELEVLARPVSGVDVFSAFGYSRARFGDNTSSSGVTIVDNRIPFSPAFTFSVGAQATRDVGGAVDLYGRAELLSNGDFFYDEANTASQDAYALTHIRVGAQVRLFFAELWVRNAFDTRYVPLAFAYPGLAPSGFVGEPGRPRTWGVSAGVSF